MLCLLHIFLQILVLLMLEEVCCLCYQGKRSISDHMCEAVKYIKDLQNRIQEMGERRDELKRFSDLSGLSFPSECLQVDKHEEDSITVRRCLEGIEVVVSTAFTNELPLSRVLEVLIGEGLNIINCLSTKINERILHTIQSEVILCCRPLRFLLLYKESMPMAPLIS